MDALTRTGITQAEYHRIQADAMTEKTFQAAILGAARRHGWLVYHTHDSRRSQPGYPDLHLVHPTAHRSLMRELKTQKGRLTTDQQTWLTVLRAAGVDADVWRPAQWFDGTIDETLATGFHR